MEEELLTTRELAAELGKPYRTLDQWRWRGLGPAYIKFGNTIRYRRSDVEAWLDSRTHQPTESASGS
jgi:excisionase family DNA binding protein